MRSRVASRVGLAGVGLLIAVGVPLGWSIADRPSGMQQINAGAAARFSNNTPNPPSPYPHGRQRTDPISEGSGRPNTQPSVPSNPVRLTIPSLHIDAPIVAVGVDNSGQMQIPRLISQIGWYKYGPAPGARSGSIVLAGHVDSAAQGLGAFSPLRDIPQHAEVAITVRDGTRLSYTVIAREAYPKSTIPLRTLFARTGRPRLTLITCRGTFSRSTHSYDDNIVVTALLAPAQQPA
jgi:sortase (surface protein transpeptidase)